ncbi:MAG TPA: TetR family transcriptional regulator C-terminal domain-containing protein [Rhizomicrobium sp.]|jgi:AcrR family transcriptional regulator
MPKKVDHSERREAFMQAAYRIIKKQGLVGVTVRAVAKEAGFTTGALVHYVDSVDQLLVEASEFAARDVRAKMLEMEALDDTLVSLREVLYLALPSDEDKRGNWNYWLGFWERSVHNAAVRHITYVRYTEWLKRTARMIRRAKAAGDIASDVDVTLASRSIVALIDGIATMVLRSGKPLSPKEQRDLIDSWVENWLKPTRPIARHKPSLRNDESAETRRASA